MDTKTFLPLSDAALRLHLSYNQTYRLMLTGQLESRRTNSRRIEVTEADVDRLAREQAQHDAKTIEATPAIKSEGSASAFVG